MESIETTINDLHKHYEERDGSVTRLIKINHNNKEYLLDRYEILEVLNFLLKQNNIDFNFFEYLTDRLNNYANSSREMHMLQFIKKELNEHKLNELYQINKYKQNQYFKELNNKLNLMFSQFNSFNSFKDNQNKYDNMLSIMKILDRLKQNNIKIDIELEFDSENDLSNGYNKLILYKGLRNYNMMKFII